MLAYILIVFAIFFRLAPHAPNFVPIIAIAMFAGAYLPKKKALFVPLLIMIISDLVIGLHSAVAFTWGAMLLCGFIGIKLRNNVKASSVMGYTLLSAVAFFIISNLGVWLVWYTPTFSGLTTCFVKAIPFFRSTLLVNGICVCVMFGLQEGLSYIMRKSQIKQKVEVKI